MCNKIFLNKLFLTWVMAVNLVFQHIQKIRAKYLIISFLHCALLIELSAQTLPAFPGAEGFGATSLGGRGGRIIRITNLNDTGTGSLRWALDQAPLYTNEPRIIIFDVCGVINGKYSDDYYIRYPFCTIAGQTAPGDGICLKGSCLIISTHDVVIRGMRVRPGDNDGWIPPAGTQNYDGPDGIAISNRLGLGDIYNVIIDHCSVSWAVDENMSVWENSNKNGQIYNISFQWNIISEALANTGIHIENGVVQSHSCGLLIGDRVENISIHNNLMAHNSGRNALIQCALKTEFINNTIYDWKDGSTHIANANNQNIPATVDVINNYYKVGPSYKHHKNPNPAYTSFWEVEGGNSTLNDNSRIYIKGNIGKNRPNDLMDEWALVKGYTKFKSTVRVATGALFPIQIETVENAHADVLKYAGALAPQRDATDIRIVGTVTNGTGKVIDNVSNVGGYPVYTSSCTAPVDTDDDGMPDWFEDENGLNKLVKDGNGTALTVKFTGREGYTNVEVYLNYLIEKQKNVNTSVVPVNKNNASFTIQPVSQTEFKISGESNIDSVDVFSMQGYKLHSSIINNAENPVSIFTSTPLSGVFIFVIKSNNKYYYQKAINFKA